MPVIRGGFWDLIRVGGCLVELSIFYDYRREGVVTTAELLWEEETSGSPAVTYTPPDVDWDPPYIPPPNEFAGAGRRRVGVMVLVQCMRSQMMSLGGQGILA